MRTAPRLSSLARRIRASLGAKFALVTSTVTLVVFVIMGVMTYQLQRETEYGQLRTKSRTLAEFVASISSERFFSYDFSALHQYAKELNAFPDVQYAVILGEDGGPLTAYLKRDDPLVAKAIEAVGGPDVIKVAHYIDSLPDSESFSAPVRFSNKVIGSVRIGITTAHANEALRRTLFLSLTGILVAILCLSVSGYYIFHRQVLRPARRLIEAAGRVAQGNLRDQIPYESEDEIGQLTRSFNEMTANLATSNDERTQAFEKLRELNRTLEDRSRAIEVANKELERMALYDPLTGLPNRVLFQDRLAQTLNTAKRETSPFVVMLMDMDRFKEVNDTYGHHTGDLLLKMVGQRLDAELRDSDTISRLGGDEFAVLLPNTGLEAAVEVANKLLKVLLQAEEVEGLSFMVTASIGIAGYPDHGLDANALLKHADVAMYEAKRAKTGYCIYSQGIDTYSPEQLTLMNDLRSAVVYGQMQLHYQPIMDVRSGATRGIEALARWNHPTRGFIPPEQFIPMIEQTGLIRVFSRWVIDAALAQWAAWRKQGIETVISVNLSMRNLQDKEFPQELSALLEKWSVVPHALLLEITESAMMSNPDHALDTLLHFRKLGVDVAIDDFGTGYSSLSYLKRMSVNEIKIDRGFVKDMCHDKDDAVIVRSTIDLAHNLGLRVVAEGVEDAQTLRLLTELNCDLVQGHLFSRPVLAELVEFSGPRKDRLSLHT